MPGVAPIADEQELVEDSISEATEGGEVRIFRVPLLVQWTPLNKSAVIKSSRLINPL